MRIFAAGLATETNVFSPLPTGLSDFAIQRGRDATAGKIDHPSLDLDRSWGAMAREAGLDFVFASNSFAAPSGKTVKTAYESLRDDILIDLRAALPVDIVLLSLHGAMIADGYDDCEDDLLRHVRDIIGPDVVVGAEFDLHCHFRPEKLALLDVAVTYKEYPHDDIAARAKEVFELALATRRGEIRPVMSLFNCRMIGFFPTSREPLRSFVDAMIAAEQRPGILSISFGHGFQFADIPDVGAKVLVIADDDECLARATAEEFGHRVYALRDEIAFHSFSLSLDEALARAHSHAEGPVVVADQSDNVGGGAPGDATYALQWLIDHNVTNAAVAILYDPEVVAIARKVGVNSVVDLRLGGKLGKSSGQPIDLDGATILAIKEKYAHGMLQKGAEPWFFPAGDIVALRWNGIEIVVSSERCQCFSAEVFKDLGIDPASKSILIVKSYQHFFAGFEAIAAEIFYMSGPGAVPPDPRLIPYQRVDTNSLFPWVPDPLPSEDRSHEPG